MNANEIQTLIDDKVMQRAQAMNRHNFETCNALTNSIVGLRAMLTKAKDANPNDNGPAITGPTQFAAL